MADATRGLEGIVVAKSSLCTIDGQKGILRYRGYDIHELAEHATFDEVSYMLLAGDLPTSDELAGFREERAANRDLSPDVAELVDRVARDAAPMELLRTAVSALSFHDPDKGSNEDGANHRKAVRLIGQVPVVIGRYERARNGLTPVDPDPELSFAANFLTMLRGDEPTEDEARVLDVALILHADHEMPASTFTARVIASTLSDLHSAIVGAIGALKGPLHGGANYEVMNMLLDIGSEAAVEEAIRGRLERKEKIPGFGHRVYKTTDPRAAILKEFARRLAEDADEETNWFELQERIEELMLEEKQLYPNVDFYSATTYHYLGIPTDLFTPVFAASRVVGWAAHVIEQYRDNRIIRPMSEYIGPEPREFPALSQPQ